MRLKIRHIVWAPLSLIYGTITAIRNWLYDHAFFKTYRPGTPSIIIGNLAVGGTGKTPHTEYLIRLLKEDYKLAFLSRGYKRKTRGFLKADSNADACKIGDEPMQVFRKYGDQIYVFVGEDRKNAIQKIKEHFPDVELLLLDDAFQHRRISAGLNIVVSAYNHFFTDDYLMPTGRLREPAKGIRRADILIISKCPSDLSEESRNNLISKVSRYKKMPIYFSTISYGQIYSLADKQTDIISLNNKELVPAILIVAGIVDPSEMKEYLSFFTERIEMMHFADHHAFQRRDIEQISRRFLSLPIGSLIITTEKDATRFLSAGKMNDEIKQKIYVLPIETAFLPVKEIPIDQKIKDYVEKNRKNS